MKNPDSFIQSGFAGNFSADDVYRRALDAGADKLEMERKIKTVLIGLAVGFGVGLVAGVVYGKVG